MDKLSQIKSQVSSLTGKEVKIITREHRGKTDIFKGKIDKVYHTFFNLKSNSMGHQQMSFSFADILTNDIVVRTPDDSIVIKNIPE